MSLISFSHKAEIIFIAIPTALIQQHLLGSDMQRYKYETEYYVRSKSSLNLLSWSIYHSVLVFFRISTHHQFKNIWCCQNSKTTNKPPTFFFSQSLLLHWCDTKYFCIFFFPHQPWCLWNVFLAGSAPCNQMRSQQCNRLNRKTAFFASICYKTS